MSSLPAVLPTETQLTGTRFPETEQIRANRAASKADETKRGVTKNWDAFGRWCTARRVAALPASPLLVEAYLVYLADDHPVLDRSGALVRKGMRPSSVRQALWAINLRHRLAGVDEPGQSEVVRTAMAGIRRRKVHRQKQQAPLTIEQIAAVPFGDDLKSLRDKALLLVGFAGCFRRSELVSLRIEDLEESRFGLRVYLARSKTDAEGKGAWVDIVRAESYPRACPVSALQTWLRAANVTTGPLFRRLSLSKTTPVGPSLSGVTVDAIVKRAAVSLGLDPAKYGGHSLRAGKATYLARINKSPSLVAKHGRWKSMDMVLRYYRDETAEGLAGAY